jgi:hypothetical protein
METIPYRNTKVLLKILPKGSLLFRRLKKDQLNDLRGLLTEDRKRCHIENFNVFFYPNPFATTMRAMGLNIHGYDKYVYVYMLTKDVKLISLIKPSKYGRYDRTRKRIFIKPCATIKKGCLTKPRRNCDVCISKSIIKKHPDIVGNMAISKTDGEAINKSLLRKDNENIRRFFHTTEDAAGTVAIPEISMSPFVTQPQEEILAEDEPLPETNFKLLTKLYVGDRDHIIRFMDKKTKYNPETFLYEYKE